MEVELQLQVIRDIIYLIEDGIGVTHNSSKYDHIFNLIFNSFMVEILMDSETDELSVSIFKGTECNSIYLEAGDAGAMDLMNVLKNKFNINNTDYLVDFINEVSIYSNRVSDNDYLLKELNNFIKSEQFEKAEQVRQRMKENDRKKKEREKEIKDNIDKDNIDKDVSDRKSDKKINKKGDK